MRHIGRQHSAVARLRLTLTTAEVAKPSKAVAITVGGIWLAVLGVIDYFTGPDISVAIFYLLPVSLVAWRVGRRAGVWMSIASVLLWYVADVMGGAFALHPVALYWNAAMRLSTSVLVTYLFSTVKTLHDTLEDRVAERTAALTAEITERKQLQEQLVRLQKLDAIGRLAGGLAHDFNNLLTVIGGYSDLLVSDLDAGNPLHRHAAAINNAAARATALTRQLLAFSRKQVLQLKVLDLNAVVTTLEPMLRRLIGEDIRLVVGLAPTLGRVKADPGQLEQVLLNLVVNARDAMPQGGTLTIETTNVAGHALVAHRQASVPPGSYVRLAVHDTGVGMDAATRSRLFEPFFTTKAPGQGTGLGLSTVYGIITQSEGHIAVDSAPAHGATFTIYLPRVEEAIAAGQRARARPETPRGRETVLVVEDEASVRSVARTMLELHGYRVLEAGGGEEALRIGARPEGPVQLLLTDVVMPGMSGPEVAQRLSRVHPELKVLYMSGYTDEAILRHGVPELSPAFVQKPFSAETLGWKVREVLDAPREEA
jgi:two-component system, cell cycle sensor histidine kinase and response regulator CckA